MVRITRLGLLLAGALLFGAACKDEVVPATEVVVAINSDLDVPAQLSRIDAHVYPVDGANASDERQFDLSATTPRAGEVRLPFSFAIAKKKASRFRLEVIGYGPIGPSGAEREVIERSIIVSFRDRETVLVKVFLGEVCFGPERTCMDGLTCYPEPEADVAAGACGKVREAVTHAIKPGDENKGWSARPDSGAPQHDAGHDAGHMHDAGNDAGMHETMDAGPVQSDSGSDAGMSNADAAPPDAGPPAPQCQPVEAEHTWTSTDHVTADKFVPNSDPPSAGPHCDNYGAWDIFTEANPLPACNFVHNLEHHGVVLLYNCPEGCPEIVDDMKQVIASMPGDRDCDFRRVVLTPYAEMTAKVAASIWGLTWTADCFDEAAQDSLLDFINRHWLQENNAPEPQNCGQGSIQP